MKHLIEAGSQFFAYLKHECGLSQNTVDAYNQDLRRFFQWMAEANLADFADLTIKQLGDYLTFLNEQSLAPATVARHVASLKMFFRYLVLDGYLTESAAELLNRPSLWERIPYVLSEHQVQQLLNAPNCQDQLWVRDRAILHMMYATGTRASEVAGLLTEHVLLEQRYCKCRGKGNKERIVPFNGATQQVLSRYMQSLRGQLLAGNTDPGTLFVSRSGKPVSRVDVWKLVKKYAARIGVGHRVSPHTLRHSFATHMLAHGVDLRVIQELLGHANIATTQHYTRVDASRLKKIHRDFHPRA